MPQKKLTQNVFDESLDRIQGLYKDGHRIIVRFSGGKDSTVALNLCIEAARQTGRLPVEVSFSDDEITYPGTDEYVERTHTRPEICLDWVVLDTPLANIFSRTRPFFGRSIKLFKK